MGSYEFVLWWCDAILSSVDRIALCLELLQVEGALIILEMVGGRARLPI